MLPSMRHHTAGVLFAFAISGLFCFGKAGAQGTDRHMPMTTEFVTPWDIFMACRAHGDVAEKVKDLCAAELPRLRRLFSRLELQDWSKAADVTRISILEARDSAEDQERTRQKTGVVVDLAIRFEPTKSELEKSHLESIRVFAIKQMQHLKQNPMDTITVLGHADSTGTKTENQILAQERADVVGTALVKAGLPASIIRARGVVVEGDSLNQYAYQRTQNRTAVVVTDRPVPGFPTIKPLVTGIGLGSGNSSSIPPLANPDMDSRFIDIGPAGLTNSLVLGATDFLVTRARQEVELYVLDAVIDKLCSLEWRLYLEQTCATLGLSKEIESPEGKKRARGAGNSPSQRPNVRTNGDTASGHNRRPQGTLDTLTVLSAPEQYRPGLPFIRAAIQHDLREIPFEIAFQTFEQLNGQPASQVLDRGLSAIFVLQC